MISALTGLLLLLLHSWSFRFGCHVFSTSAFTTQTILIKLQFQCWVWVTLRGECNKPLFPLFGHESVLVSYLFFSGSILGFIRERHLCNCVLVMLSWNLCQLWSRNTKVTFFFLISFLAASDLIACVGGSTLRPNGEGIVSSRFIFFTLGLPTLPFTSLMALPKLCSSRSWASTFWEAEQKDESWFKCSRLPDKITLDNSSLHKKNKGQLLQESKLYGSTDLNNTRQTHFRWMLSPLFCSALHLPVRCASLENNKWQQQTYIQLLDEHRQVLLPQILWRLFLQVIQLSSLHTNTHIHSVNQHVIVYIFLHVRMTDVSL